VIRAARRSVLNCSFHAFKPVRGRLSSIFAGGAARYRLTHVVGMDQFVVAHRSMVTSARPGPTEPRLATAAALSA